jgi:hypothetical protein
MTSRAAGRQHSFLVAILGLLAALMLLPTDAASETPSSPLSTVPPTASAASEPLESGDPLERCIDQELVKPAVEKAALYEPGKYSQSEVVALQVAATPEACRGVVQREIQFEITKKELRRVSGKLRHKFIRLLWFSSPGYTKDEAGPMGIAGAANPHRGKWVYYHCSVGRARTKVRLNIRVIVTDLSTDKEAARKVFPGPLLEIQGINKGKGC